MRVGFTNGAGNTLAVQTDGGWDHYMGHLDSFAPGIANGQRVTAGDIVGYVGNSGTLSNGVVHLHYSTHKANDYYQSIDPWPALHAVEMDVCD